jgi:hypothetical protein
MVHASDRSSRGLSRAHLALVTLVVLSVGSVPGMASAAPGSPMWAERYDGPAGRLDSAVAVGVSPDGSVVFVTGASRGTSNGYDYATVAYDASSGGELWVAPYNGPANDDDKAAALGVSPDGSVVFVTGTSGTTTGNAYATVAYDASSGDELWATRFKGSGSSDARALGVSPDGSAVIVTGVGHGATRRIDYATVAYDASTGSRLWTTRYNGPAHRFDAPTALRISPDGSAVFVTGVSIGSTTGYDYATVAYDVSTGDELWATRYNGPADYLDVANALGVSTDGSEVFVTGRSDGSTSASYATLAYDASTGKELWATRYTGPANGLVYGDAARALGVSPDGSEVFVTGGSTGSTGTYDYTTVAYDPTSGDELWVKRYDGPRDAYDRAIAIGVSPDASEVFVTGYSKGSSSGYDYATVAYDASTGTKLWVKRYDGPANGHDYASALEVSPVGSQVFVTGTSNGSTNYDYATVAYRAA